MATRSTPPRIAPRPDPVDPELEPLLSEPFSRAWAASDPADGAHSSRVRGRLLDRLGASQAASAAMVTARFRRLAETIVAPGVSVRQLYAAPTDRALRAGEPLRACLIELQPGARWSLADATPHREWLVLRGGTAINGDAALAPRDYRIAPAGVPVGEFVGGDDGALLFLRESTGSRQAAAATIIVRDAESDWPEFAPGIRRRVLWQHEGQAALLYLADPGASVPMHAHGHDEECLMVQGELFLDDTLLQAFDYQLAPAGTRHRVTETDTGVVLYAHGDLDLQFVG